VRVWETPHYTASLLDYHVFASRYGAFFERVQVFDVFTQGLAVPELEALSATDPDSSSPARPYALHSAMYGNVCLPENLGYYSPGRVDGNGLNMTEATKVLYAQKHLVVRDSIVCFYYHPYRGVGPATNMVHQIRGLGYTYVAPESLYWDEPVSVAGNADSNAAETVRLMSGVVSNLAAHVAIGDAGSSNRLELQSGAVLSNPSAVIGARVGSGGNLGRVADTGSLWSLDRRLAVGRGGSDNALIVTNGAVVASRDAVVGQEASALRNTAVVTGAGSHWTNRYGLVVGLEGSSNRVEVAGGGRITATYVELAGATNACGNSLVVWGAGSRLECRGHVAAGVSGPGNCIQVGEGARVESAAAFVGVESGAAGNAVRVEGAGTCWSNRHVLAVGVDSLGNCMSITTGATVWCAGAVVGDYDGSRDNRLEVAGSNTLLAVAGDVRVGRDGRSNTLWVADGAGVWCTNAVIGEYWSATNNAATARGPGARWIVEGPLVVGQDGVNSRLLVTNGGTVQAASLAVNAASATGGAVVVAGGALVLTNGVGPAALSLARGATLDVQEGVLQAGRVTIPSGCRMTLGTGTVLQGAGVITNEGLLSVAAAMDFPLSLVVSGNGLLTGAASNAWGVGGDFVCTSTNPGLELARTAFTCRSGAVHRVAISSANWSNSLRGFYRNRSLGRLDVHGTVDVVNVCYVWRLSGDGLLRVGSGSRLYYLSADGWSGALELSGDGVCEQVPLEVTQLTRLTQGGMRVDWTSCSGLSFRVEWADGPAGAYAAATNLPGTGNTNAWTDGGGQGRTHPSNAAMRLYRITAFP
jgi:T5SS/PEP-CTERM-associated repeat protein